jgi:hypothetical protein
LQYTGPGVLFYFFTGARKNAAAGVDHNLGSLAERPVGVKRD